MKLPTIHQTPFLRFLIPMIVGILVYSYQPNSWIGTGFGIVSILIYLSTRLIRSTATAYRFRYLFGISVSLAFVSIGFFATYYKEKSVVFDFPKGKSIYHAEIISVPAEKERSIYCQLKVFELNDKKEVSNPKQIIAYLHKDNRSKNLLQGDQLWIYAEPQALINTNRPGNFDFATYLHRQGFSATTYIDSAYWKKLPIERAFNLNYYATDLQEKILAIFRSFQFNEKEFALLSGITIGYKDALTVEQKSNFSAVGLSHLMAVSGMQTAMVYSMFWFLLGFIPKNSRFYHFKYLAVILGLWIFTYITGLSASVVRASIMLTVFLVGGLFDKQPVTLNSLAFSAFCLLLYNPLTLYDIGFQLSYMAVISIIFAQNLLENSFAKLNKPQKYFSELTTMTLAAQLGTSPLSIFYFHQFPLLFLLLNLIVLPFNAFIVYLASFCTALSAIQIPVLWFGDILQLMLYSLDKVTEFFAQLPFAQIRNLNPMAEEVALFYLFLAFVLMYIYKKRFRLLIYSLSTLFLIEISMIGSRMAEESQNQILVYNQFGKNVVEYIDRGKSTIVEADSRAIYLGGKRLMRINSDIRYRNSNQKLRCDYLILEKGFKGSVENLNKQYQYKSLILDASLSRFYCAKIENNFSEIDRKCYNIAKQGAFVLSLIND